MKNELQKLVYELFSRKEFENGNFSMTLNFKNVIDKYRSKNVNLETLKESINLINSTDIESFNVTIRTNRGTDMDYECIYEKNWKSVSFIFHGKSDQNPNFEFDVLSSNETFRISDKLRLYGVMDENDRPTTKERTEFDWDKSLEVLDLMIELDKLLDKQYNEKQEIFNKFIKQP